jgi:hypothetical protein
LLVKNQATARIGAEYQRRQKNKPYQTNLLFISATLFKTKLLQ